MKGKKEIFSKARLYPKLNVLTSGSAVADPKSGPDYSVFIKT
jgi:hypothetical protein